MSRRELARILRVWQNRLNLDHWTVKLTFDAQGDDLGECVCSDAYDEATVKLNAGYTRWARDEANRTIVHELLHVLTRDRTAAVESARPLMAAAGYRAFIDRHTFEDEGCVERLAAILVDLGGPA